MTLTMPKTFREQLTNWLLGISVAFGGTLGGMILNNQNDMQKDITSIKVAVGIGTQKNIDQDDDIKRLQDAKNVVRLFKHEPNFRFEND